MPDGPLFPVDFQCGFLHKVSNDIAQNPLHFRGGFRSELWKKKKKKTTNMADVHEAVGKVEMP